ncbi:hypothetical protein E3Q04_03482 [Wallemia mellicola]|nr:hypothetical protein E3Q04_03482 [Wallemia mellicola]
MTSRYLQNMQKQYYNLNQQLNSPCHNFEKVQAPVTSVPNSKLKVKRWVHNKDLKLDLSDDEDVKEVINIDESDPNSTKLNLDDSTVDNTHANTPDFDPGTNSVDPADPSAAAKDVIHPKETQQLHEPSTQSA